MNKYKVSELTDSIKLLLEKQFAGVVMVSGEVAELSRASSGHVYFSLKDEGSKIKAVLFKHYIKPDSFIPANGNKVNAIGEVRLYSPEGAYQLMVRKVVYDTEGDIWKRFEETKRRLAAEGLFEQSAKKIIPLFPKKVALLTALNGAAVRDFIVTAKSYGYFFDIDIWPIPVQGIDCAPAIAAIIRKVGRMVDRYHTLILTRGGGSPDDLAVFNEEVIARALKESVVPTISAIGHEHDFTISDFTADERVATPTAAAVRVSRAYKDATGRLNTITAILISRMRWGVENAALAMDKAFSGVISFGPSQVIKAKHNIIKNLNAGMISNLRLFVIERKARYGNSVSTVKHKSPLNAVSRYEEEIKLLKTGVVKNFQMYGIKRRASFRDSFGKLKINSPAAKIALNYDRVDSMMNRILAGIKNRLEKNRHLCELAVQRVKLMNPDNLLDLGYAVALKADGSIVSNVNSVSLEEELEIKLKDGYITTFVTGKKLEKNN